VQGLGVFEQREARLKLAAMDNALLNMPGSVHSLYSSALMQLKLVWVLVRLVIGRADSGATLCRAVLGRAAARRFTRHQACCGSMKLKGLVARVCLAPNCM
jgi:hypothetical protein